jgi:hypothetical protein
VSTKLVMTACALAACGVALAKLPPLDAAAKAKAAETAARAAWSAKVDAYKLCKVQDQIASRFGGKSGVMRTAATTPAGTTSAATGAAAPSASAAPTSSQAAAAILSANPQAAAAPPAGVNPASPAVTPPNPQVGQAGGTPVATVAAAPTIPPCADPGPFAYNPPAQTPLETSGAHSPAGNAATPPSVLPNSSQMAPAQSATPQSKKP